ncbi:DNA polymerase epsilon catalytic subunit A C-terminal [Arabidopsis suecica]|uniref:DNA polymerase epsilon catalytic subunit n=1 Tax=Arabidopsis suecica TaxID=45249 RepID=A0A8T2H2H7_ARASU|nr:DNA polymerase epsilon catalytic subunit A C-terminal [Arabidopsis suecica]
MSGDNRRRDRKDSRWSKKPKVVNTAEDELESKLGFGLFSEGETRLGWLLTFSSSSWEDRDTGKVYSCVDLYFVTQDGFSFKTKYKFRPYFYAATKDKMELEVEAYLRRRYERQVADIEIVEKEDLDLKNHLSGLQKKYLKISFDTVQQLMEVKRDLLHIVERNQAKFDALEAYESILAGKREQRPQDCLDSIVDLREYDVPYHVRFAIDNDVRSGQWYNVSISSTDVILEKRTDLLQRAEVRVCAFDIETTKLPLKFPDAEYDQIMMISYMVDGQGFLIINRECVGEDVEDLEYTPKPEFEGYFKVTNVKNEVELLQRWFYHMQELKPGIYVTYNGDFFDWPFIERRASHHGIKMNEELGFRCDHNQGECRAKFVCHLDCFAWVKRDSYLPQGSHGLKAVTKAKLGYDPLEVNPEDMVRFAMEKPQTMASYSVSDAVATYYLYMTYVNPFIFSLATIIPMVPDEVLRKGSGTLCEMLLMVQAYKANVVCPNKNQADPEKFYQNQLLESETYIGGHVECLESGVFRSDIPTSFKLDSSAYQQLIDNLGRDLEYAITVEGKMRMDSISNYDEVKDEIKEKLEKLRDDPIREEGPLIYHLDVAAMYPNIILTNRLQPPSIVTDEVCTACDFNRPGKTCLRKLEWVWRGVTFMGKKSDYYHLKKQIESEFVDAGANIPSSKSFLDLPKVDQQSKLKERLKKYCQKAYKRVLDKPITEVREAGICMRENPFYVDTVRSFRDRRYEYKTLNKVWKGKLSEAKASGNSIKIQEAQDMVVVYDSLQLAHKCILNSFYGYVMRKGARWYSMEMAGVVTYTGAKIIQNARLLIERIGKPLELDTDGIWCCLPGSFPENFTFKTIDMKKLTISYPCVMLNVDVAKNNTNDQYQTLVDPVRKTYESHSECSIEFEVDGPYKAMIIPASKEEGILIKKRYAVFNHDGTLAELKGFEIKRRGELKLIKVFQAELFDKFLYGSTLEECYSAVAEVADRWLDLLDNQGKDIADSELLDYISESSTMSKSLADYGEQKSCAVTTAKRLAEFLGLTMVKDKGLRCQYIVACEPKGTPVSERAVPVAIFTTNPEVMKFHLRKWCKTSSDVGIRLIIDWSYYKQRLSSAIQKVITIPAAMQKVANPVPRVLHPDWLHKKVREKDDKFRQRKLVDMFSSANKDGVLETDHPVTKDNVEDIEDFCKENRPSVKGPKPIARSYEVNKKQSEREQQESCDPEFHDISFQNIDKSVNYQGWLELKKRKWKVTLEKKKKRRLGDLRSSNQSDAHEINQKVGQGRGGVGSYFRRPEEALTSSHWQIIQLVPSPQSGQFFAWVVVEGLMLKIPLTIPRVFYINSKVPIAEYFQGKSVNKILPHGRPCYSLTEVKIQEDKFKKESKKRAALLADPRVEGIYETKVPLEFSAICQIGCVCKIDNKVKHRNTQNGWEVGELHMKTTTECHYLERSIPLLYLYNSTSTGRAIYVLYCHASKLMSAVVVDPFNGNELLPSALERQFRDSCQELSLESLSWDGIRFQVRYVDHPEAAKKIIQIAISEYREENCGPTVAVIECPDFNSMKEGIKALDDFPCVRIPFNGDDNSYQPVSWQRPAAKIAMFRCAAAFQWLDRRIAQSRYAHVPLGNFGLDWLTFTIDIFLSRALRDQQQVLWVSDNGVPDLGGINNEEAFFADEVQQTSLIFPGAYRKVSVELKIHNLAVNALLKSNLVNEMEGGGFLGFEQDVNPRGINSNDNTSFDETTGCAQAFRVLKQLIHSCLTDVRKSENIYADSILQRLSWWLCSPSSKLHDPALHLMLHKVMQKVFALLLTDLRRLGAIIIYADFSKVIIDTVKFDLSAAKAYCESLLSTVGNSDIFEWILLEPVHYWHSLLFMDQYNYAGIRATDDEISLDEVIIEPKWSVARHLPEYIERDFIIIVAKFIFDPWKFAIEKKTGSSESLEAQMVEYLREQIGSTFINMLVKKVDDIMSHMKEINVSDASRVSAQAPKGDYTLEFIQVISAVLALDQNVQQDVLVMRKSLLRYIKVKECAAEAEFLDPGPSFILPNVACSNCDAYRDLDICRDPALLTEKEWSCADTQCGKIYDREKIESSLLEMVRQRERMYHMQDLVCIRCNQVKAAHLTEQCECSGSFRCKESGSEFSKRMEIFLDIAKRQKFRLLEEYISWILFGPSY